MGLCASQALALSLGRISVLSPLGEPLLAEVEILDINSDEAASLKASTASPEAFKAAGLEYNPALTKLTITLEKRPDDRSYLRIRSEQSINDPFVDLMLEANWASGRIVRDYTLLFDPPNSRPNQVSTRTAPQLSTVPAQVKATTAPQLTDNNATSASSPARAPLLPRAVVKKSSPPAGTPSEPGKNITVKPGDTAGRIASALVSPSISLDQILVAMLRTNPDAFVAGNVNRIRAGAVLKIPSSDDVQATPMAEAKQIIFTQSQDFNAFRSKLASAVSLTTVAAADRQSSGKVQPKVDDKKTNAPIPDKLTLSQGTVSGKANEATIAKDRQAKEIAKKTDDVSKAIADLNKLVAATATVPSTLTPETPASSPKPAITPGLTVATEITSTVAAASEPASATADASAPQAVAVAPQPVASTPLNKVVASASAPAPAPESSFIDQLLDDPLVPAAAGGLIALLAGLGFYRYKKHKNSTQIDSMYMESRIPADSFFGASGGQQIDTHDSAMSGSSMLYTPSQLESADDVDPVAEADVYLAYGRDIQAEEILKEALRIHPDRVAIHQKLLEIYAKRRDLKNFERISKQALTVTGSESQEWGRISELGRSIDPSNDLYQSITPLTTASATQIPSQARDFDLDLDFSLENAPAIDAHDATQRVAANALSSTNHITPPVFDLDFNTPEIQSAPNHKVDLDSSTELAYQASSSEGLESASYGSLPTAPVPLAQAPAQETKALNDGLLEFDLGSLSLDLGPTTEQTPENEEDPLDTKLALAIEFGSIGDLDGARNLIEEVIAEASGEMKIKAQQALSQLR
jgi:pilus assembly protein FimV